MTRDIRSGLALIVIAVTAWLLSRATQESATSLSDLFGFMMLVSGAVGVFLLVRGLLTSGPQDD